MKRFLLISFFAIASAITISSCTEESVEPKSESDAAPGGSAIDKIVKG